jgi:hypothetical protein
MDPQAVQSFCELTQVTPEQGKSIGGIHDKKLKDIWMLPMEV